MKKKLFITLCIATALTPQTAAPFFRGSHFGGFGGGWGWGGSPLWGAPLVEPIYTQPIVDPIVMQPIYNSPVHIASITPITETDQYTYKFAIPGHSHNDVEVNVNKKRENIHVLIRGNDAHHTHKDANGMHMESSSASSQSEERTFTPPADADLDHVTAQVSNGMLTIRVKRVARTTANGHRKIKVQNMDGN